MPRRLTLQPVIAARLGRRQEGEARPADSRGVLAELSGGSQAVSFTPIYCFAAADENERARRVPQHHGALAPQCLLAAHHATAQRRAALRSAR